MATLAQIKTRIDDELAIAGSFKSQVKENIVQDALMRLCRKADPLISANMAVTVSEGVGPYNIPAAIDRIDRIYNNATTPAVINFNTDLRKREVTLLSAPSDDGNFVVYGTPRALRTNLETIVAALPENYEDVLWQLVRAFAMRQAGAMETFKLERNAADDEIAQLRFARNRDLDQYSMPVQQIDTVGNVVADKDNVEGTEEDIDDYLESDL